MVSYLRSYKNILIASLVLIMLIPVLVHSHGAGGSYEEEKDGYLIDVGYNPESILANQRARIDFNLLSLSSTTAKDLFTDVWVRITKDNEIYFSGNLVRPYFGPTAMNLKMVDAGEYDVYVRYQNEGESVVDTTFILAIASTTPIEATAPNAWWNSYYLYALGGLGGVLIMVIVRLLRRRNL